MRLQMLGRLAIAGTRSVLVARVHAYSTRPMTMRSLCCWWRLVARRHAADDAWWPEDSPPKRPWAGHSILCILFPSTCRFCAHDDACVCVQFWISKTHEVYAALTSTLGDVAERSQRRNAPAIAACVTLRRIAIRTRMPLRDTCPCI